MENEIKGTLLAILAAVISGISIPANKIFVVSMDPVIFTGIRSIVIGIAFFLVMRSSWIPFDASVKKVKQHPLFLLALIAIIGGAIAFILFFTGLKLTTAARAAFLHKTLPLYVIVLATLFLKEKLPKQFFLAAGLMILGTIAIYATSIPPGELWANPQVGDLLVLAAAMLWGVENVISKKAMKQGESNAIVSFVRMFFGGLILLGVALLMGKVAVLGSLTSQHLMNIGVSTVLLFGYVLCFYWSIKLINVSKAATFLLLAPMISFLIAVTLLGEPAPFVQVVGSVFILLGAYLLGSVKSEQAV